MSGAKVYVDGEEVTTTDHSGNFQLLNVTTGRYNIKVCILLYSVMCDVCDVFEADQR